jgi:NADH dehydrogenase
MLEKDIVIVGAGFAGVLTAKKLAKRLKKQADVRITLIDKHPYHTMLTQIQEVAANRVEEDSVRISLQKIFAGRRVDVRLDTVTGIDYDAKTVRGENGSYRYDYLVLASGSKPMFWGIPGAEEFSYAMWSFEDALALKHHVVDLFQKASSETDAEKKRRMLTFYIVGAGFTGVEMTGELAEWIPVLCDEFEIDRSLVKIVDIDMLDRVVPTFPPRLSAKAERRLHKMGVTVTLKAGITQLGDGYIEYKKDGETVRENTSTVIWTAGVTGSDIAEKSDALKLAKRGRVQTDDFLRAEGRTDVYVAGDNVFYIPEGSKSPVPQMVENAEASAGTVAHNITAEITGAGEPEKYAPKFHGAMLSIGGRYGIAYVGGEKSKIALASFFAMFVKHLIYVIYFIQILGWNKVFSYARREFFTVRHCRSFLGGHFSNRTPSFLLVPLRVFFGAFWIFEGAQKISEGWLSSPKLAAYFKGASDVFTNLARGAAKAGDTTSSATTTAKAVSGKLLADWNILGIFHVVFVNTTDVAVKIQFGLMDWFNKTFVTGSNGSQMFFQYFVVISEILLGALLILGLFTFLSSAFSLALQAMFLMSTGMYMSTWWMVFTAVALLIGSGHTLGLDYYVIPALKKHWKNVRWARKLYIYND